MIYIALRKYNTSICIILPIPFIVVSNNNIIPVEFIVQAVSQQATCITMNVSSTRHLDKTKTLISMTFAGNMSPCCTILLRGVDLCSLGVIL